VTESTPFDPQRRRKRRRRPQPSRGNFVATTNYVDADGQEREYSELVSIDQIIGRKLPEVFADLTNKARGRQAR
jgi:hypothetical protein